MPQSEGLEASSWALMIAFLTNGCNKETIDRVLKLFIWKICNFPFWLKVVGRKLKKIKWSTQEGYSWKYHGIWEIFFNIWDDSKFFHYNISMGMGMKSIYYCVVIGVTTISKYLSY